MMDASFRVSKQLLFFFNKELGHGPKSNVFEGRFEDIPVAVKRVQCADNNDAEKSMKDFKMSREKQVMNEIERERQCNIVGYYTSFVDGRYMYFALELCDGHLGDYVRRHELTLTYPPHRVNHDIASGIDFLHSRNIAHRDLKPENVYFVIRESAVQKFVIGDFGTSKSCVDDYFTMSGVMGTFGYIAREVWNQLSATGDQDVRGKMSVKADIFALGCIFFYTVTRGQHPFGNIDKQSKISNGDRPDLHIIDASRHTLKTLLHKMLDHCADNRPTAADILRHPALWPAAKVLTYLKDVHDDLEHRSNTDEDTWNDLDNPDVIWGGNWMINMPKKLKAYLEIKIGQDNVELADTCRRVGGVLQIITYVTQNYRSFPAEVREELGSYPDGHVNTWMKLCPRLLMHVYDSTNELDTKESTHIDRDNMGIDVPSVKSKVTVDECVDVLTRVSNTTASQVEARQQGIDTGLQVGSPCSQPVTTSLKSNAIVGNSNERLRDDMDQVSSHSTTRTETAPNPPVTDMSVNFRPEVVHQTETLHLPDDQMWSVYANTELAKVTSRDVAESVGDHTVFCIDISESMARGDAWTQTRRFLETFIECTESVRRFFEKKDDSISLVTFGHETRIVQRRARDTETIKTTFDTLKLGGPSPMFGGLVMATATAVTQKRSTSRPQIVILSDGRLTDTCLFCGPDVQDVRKHDQTKAKLVEIIENFNGSVEFIFVPVGNHDKEFFDLISSVCGCMILNYDDAKELIKHRHAGGSNDMYLETFNTGLPEVGSRVCRGPDWKWGNQDNGSPGTVIGHDSQGSSVWVEWDVDSHRNCYRYGNSNCYDVLLGDTVRNVSPYGRLTVGCLVVKGCDSSTVDTRLTRTQTGVVIKILGGEQRVEVRWKDGTRTECSFGENNTYDIWPWSPDDSR